MSGRYDEGLARETVYRRGEKVVFLTAPVAEDWDWLQSFRPM